MRFASCFLAASVVIAALVDVACAAPFAFVPSGSFYEVAVFDTATNAVVATIHGPGNCDGVAVRPDGLRAYFTSNYAYNYVVWVLDTTTYSVVTPIPVGSFPTGIAVSPAGTRAYVANTNSNSISVIDTSSNTVVDTFAACNKPWGIAVHPAGARLYVGCSDPVAATASVGVFATADGSPIASVSLGGASWSPVDIAIHPSGKRVFVASTALVAIDTDSNTVANIIPVGSRPSGVALDPTGKRAYVSNSLSGTVSVVDTERNMVIGTVAVGGDAAGVSVHPDGTHVYVANTQLNNVAVIDAASNAVIATIPVSGSPLAFGEFIGGRSPPPPAAPVPGPARQVAAGSHHTCAVVAGGGVKCWGWNLHGQLGDGTVADRSAPTDVSGLSEPVVAVAAGAAHACALSTAGGVKCWGWNSYGQLGDGSAGKYDWYSRSTVARDVVGLTSGVSAIAAGADHTCALTSTGSVLCWGGNDSGQLGDGTGNSRGTPKPVSGLPAGIAGIAAGTGVSAAITGDGRLKYWGRERVVAACPGGPVCLPINQITTVPKDAPVLPGAVAAVSLSDPFIGDTCVLLLGGRVMCWGGMPWRAPSDIAGLLPNATAIAIRGVAGCALVNGGIAQCWGADTALQAATVAGLPSGLTGIAVGGATCALTAEGEVMCWGTNQYGEVGGGNTLSRPAPVVVISKHIIPALVVEYYHAGLDHYFITWVPDEIAVLDAGVQIRGWVRTGRVFNGYTTVLAGASSVCRFYIPPALGDSHFFGRGPVECTATSTKNPSFVLEDASFMTMFLPAAGVCPSNTVDVYRVFSNRPDANHRYMTDKGVRDQMVAKGWLAEGDGPNLVVMCAPR